MRTFLILARRPLAAAALAGLIITAAPSAQTADTARYRTYDEMTAAIKAINSPVMKVVDLGKSHEGRSVWALELANRSGAVPVDQRPALFVGANFEGDQLIGSELALYLARHLAQSYGSDAQVKKLLDEHAVYIVPRANPDGAERMFAKVKSFHRTNARKFDDDNDGRTDEDGPEDLNGDGFISVMRVKDPKGSYMQHPDDARLLRRADATRGEAGAWSVYWEGTDNDGDGFLNEDGPGGVDLNRNFQHRYPYYTPDAGPHMVSEPETRAVMDYILSKRNVAAILTFGASDNLIGAPTRQGALAAAQTLDLLAFADQSVAGARRTGTFAGGGGAQDFFFAQGGGAPPQARPAGQPAPTPPVTTVAPQDVEYFRTVSDRYRALTNVRTAPATRAPGGAFFEYGYYQFGVPSFSTPGWGMTSAAPQGTAPQGGTPQGGPPQPSPAGGRQGSSPAGPGAAPQASGDDAGGSGTFDARVAQAIGDGFIAWTPFTHPSLGAVEIGGFKPYTVVNPPASQIDALGKSHAAFAMYLTTLFPRVAIAGLEASSLGGGLYRIEADVENAGYLPTSTAHGVRARSVKPVMVQLGVAPDAIVSGDAKTNFIPALAGSGRRQSYQWIVRAKPGQSISVKAVAQKGGAAERTVTLK
ncbi:MAG: M14 family metallopeptidase [Acidobacteriota bacterium]|nr:M14 family metallopeptidase [Acidobacteriota bacterium]